MISQQTPDPKPVFRIWIAEDDDEFRETLGHALAGEHREVHLFKDGRATLDAIPEGQFDILIVDLMMPGADGIRVLSEVKRSHPDRIVIIMTGYASIDSAIQAIRGGAYDYIRKPFKFEELEIAIANASEKLLLVRENQCLRQRLDEADRDVSWLKQICSGVAHSPMDERDPGVSEMELILNQLNPLPPDKHTFKENRSESVLPLLEKLVQFKKEGLIDSNEFSSFKRMLLNGRV